MSLFLSAIVIASMLASCSDNRQQNAEITGGSPLASLQATESENNTETATENYTSELPIDVTQSIEFNRSTVIQSYPDYIDKIDLIGWSRNALLAYRYFTPAGGYGGLDHNFVILNAITDEIIGHSSINLDKEDIEFYRTEYNSSLLAHNISGQITDPGAGIENNYFSTFPYDDFQCWFDYSILDDNTVEWKLIIGNGIVQKTITEQISESPFLDSIRILGFFVSPYENRIAVFVSLVFVYPLDESFSEGRLEETVSFTPMLFGCNMNVGFTAVIAR